MNKFKYNLAVALLLSFTLVFSSLNVFANDINLETNRDNIAPSASFSPIVKKKLDVIVLTDYKGEKLGKLQSALTDFKAQHLSKYDIRSVVANNLPKMDLGSQIGSYNVDVYGIVGNAQYIAEGKYVSSDIHFFDEIREMKVCLNPQWVMPGQTPPSGTAIVPTQTTKVTKDYTYNNSTWKCDVYTFKNNYGMDYTYYPYYNDFSRYGCNFDYLKSDTPGINCGYLPKYYMHRDLFDNEWFDTYELNSTTPSTLQFTFNQNISYFKSETYSSTNTVRALNLYSDDLKARDNSQAFYIIAMDGSSTDFYQSSIYNSDNSLNYMFGNLRTDNLGQYVKGSNAIVLADVDSSALDMNFGDVTKKIKQVYIGDDTDGSSMYDYVPYYENKYNMNFDSTTALQNMTLNQLLQSGSDGRFYDRNEIDGGGVVGRLDYFLTQGKAKIDLTVVSDKDTGYANKISDLVKSSVGGSVDVKTTVIDSSSARKNIGQRTYYNFKDNILLRNNLLRIGDEYNNTWYNLGALKDETVTSATVAFTNVKDIDTITLSKWPSGYDEEDATINYLITSDGDLYTSEGYFTYNLLSNSERSGYYCKLNRSAINNEQVKSWSPIYYTNVNESTRAYYGMYVITENNNLYFLEHSNVTLVCTDVYTTTVYKVAANSSATAYKYILVGVKKNGEAYQYGYNTSLSKYCDAKSSPINRIVDGHIVTENGTSYEDIKAYLDNAPSSTSYSDWVSVNDGFIIFKDGRIGTYVPAHTDYESNIYVPAYYNYLNIPQGNAVKMSKYPDIGGSGWNRIDYYIQLFDNSIIDTRLYKDPVSLDSNKETDYTDYKYFDIFFKSGINGVLLKADTNGNVFIDVYNNNSYAEKYVEIQIQDNIARQMVTPRVINVESINNDLIKAAPLREGSDRIIIYASDKYRTQVGAGVGTYFPWGGIDSSMRSYLESNNYAAYFITPKEAMPSKFVPPYITNQYYNSLNSLCFAHIFDSYRFDSTDQLSAYLSNRYGISGLIEDPNGIYLIQGEDTLSYSIKYDDFEADPMNALKWKFTHDPNYFENSNGLNPYSGQWQTAFNQAPYQVGKYVIECQAQDIPLNKALFKNYWLWSDNSGPQTVYVHRRPIASFTIDLSHNGTGFNTAIVDNSYDLDRQSLENRGIVKWKWKYRVKETTDWIYGKLPSYVEGKTVYEISLEVLDRQGAWSKPYSVILDTSAVNLPPTVDADPTAYGWTNQNISVTVTADDKGENDFNRTTYKSSTSTIDPGTTDGIMYQKQFPLTYTAEGIWYLHMHVFDNIGNTFYRYRGPYKIDKTPPGGTAVPYEHAWTNQNVSMTFNPWDNLSGVQKWRYHMTDNDGASWGAWTGYAWGPAAATVLFNYEGLHRMQAEITDNAGNINYVTTGKYLIDKTPPVITPDKDGPVEVYDSITVNLTLTDNLSGVKQTKYCFTQSTEKPTDDWTTSTKTNIPAAFDHEGTWYLHVECEDNAGNVSYKVLGSFNIIHVRIYDLTVTMMNDIIWRDFYYTGEDYDYSGNPSKYLRREGTDIKAYQMPVNNYNGSFLINYGVNGVDSGCEVSFYLRTLGNPDNLVVYAHYVTASGDGMTVIQPEGCENQLWRYSFTIPLECLEGTYVTFDAEARKNGRIYGLDYWFEPWLPLNNDRKIFYITGNAEERLKFNQSH